jgi:hypothetical protein
MHGIDITNLIANPGEAMAPFVIAILTRTGPFTLSNVSRGHTQIIN